MHGGIAIPQWRGKRSRHSRRMHNPQFLRIWQEAHEQGHWVNLINTWSAARFRISQPFQMTSSCQHQRCGVANPDKLINQSTHTFYVSTVSADCSTSLDARTSAGTMVTKIGTRIFIKTQHLLINGKYMKQSNRIHAARLLSNHTAWLLYLL